MNNFFQIINENKKIIEQIQKIVDKGQNHIDISSDREKNDLVVNKEKIDLNEYFTNEKIDIKINSQKWYINKSNIKIKQDKMICRDINSNQYISYMEKNCKFTLPPDEEILDIDNRYQYIVQFKPIGENAEKINLYIVLYDDTKKLYMERIKANEKKTLTITKDVKNIRLAIKVENNVVLDLGKSCITITKYRKLDYMHFTDYRKIGFDAPKELKDLKVACIFDPFTMQCFEPEVDLIVFTPDNWKAVFEFNRPHILMVESAWKGNNESWTNRVSKNTDDLREVIEWCKKNNIPTVFWNKEDPVHYDVFINTAKNFDYIFTTNKECVIKYKNDLKREHVFTLPFAAQPKLHNPTELLSGRKDGVCFAGSYYRHKYEHRAKDTTTLLEACKPYNLDIYDRNYNSGIENYKFPDEYIPYVRGVLTGREIVKANKGYKVVINLNTVKDSSTMFARRVFELLASNTPVISNYSKGINDLFEGLVVAEDNKEHLDIEIEKLMMDEDYYLEKRLKGLREVYSKHTYEHRMRYMCSKIGINIENKNYKLVVIGNVDKLEEIERLDYMLANQEYIEFDTYYITSNKDLLKSSTKCIECIDEINLLHYDFITYLSPYNYYGKYYLNDLVIASKYSDADIIGKSSIYSKDGDILNLEQKEEYMKSDRLNKESMMVRLESVAELSNKQIIEIFSDNSNIDDQLNKYAIDRFNFINNVDEEFADIIKLIKEVEK